MAEQELDDSRGLVVLVHGIWMTGLEMAWLGHGLARDGFKVKTFFYSTLLRSAEQNAKRLRQFIQSLDAERVHLVGHSMGGIVLLHLFHQFQDLPPGRVVFLGSPVQGSAVAQEVARQPWLRPLLGQSSDYGLLGGAPDWCGKRELGVIAGNSGLLGLGRLFGGLGEEHDGTVAVAETQVPGASDTMVLEVGHFDMLFSREVMQQASYFLQQGRFYRD